MLLLSRGVFYIRSSATQRGRAVQISRQNSAKAFGRDAQVTTRSFRLQRHIVVGRIEASSPNYFLFNET